MTSNGTDFNLLQIKECSKASEENTQHQKRFAGLKSPINYLKGITFIILDRFILYWNLPFETNQLENY